MSKNKFRPKGKEKLLLLFPSLNDAKQVQKSLQCLSRAVRLRSLVVRRAVRLR